MKQHFTREIDSLLKRIIQIYGTKNWYFIANEFNRQLQYTYNRTYTYTPRQCRDRWVNFLNNATFTQNREWSTEESQLLISKYTELGPKWSAIAESFPYHSVISVKNRWHLLKRNGSVDLYSNDLDYESEDFSPTYHQTRRQTYCPSSFRISTKRELYYNNCISRNETCTSSFNCYKLNSDGLYKACPNARFTCSYCSKTNLTANEIQIDHINPVSHYLDRYADRKTAEQIADWYNNTDNLQILCSSCNLHKSDNM